MPRQSKKPKEWLVTIYNKQYVVQSYTDISGKSEKLIGQFVTNTKALYWANKCLINGKNDWFAVIEHKPTYTRNVVYRRDALAQFLKMTI
jgi:hypothetical protein